MPALSGIRGPEAKQRQADDGDRSVSCEDPIIIEDPTIIEDST
jgi:hypothetical protein